MTKESTITPASSIDGLKVLIIDDHKNIRTSLRVTLESEGCEVSEADCVAAGIVKLGDPGPNFPYHVVLLDIRMPDGSGLEILSRLSQAKLASRVIMISGEGTLSEAFQATQQGAFDYIEKPFLPERILVSVRRCAAYNNFQTQIEGLKKENLRGKEILGDDIKIVEVQSLIERVAPTNGRVLITGESGTGKELVAKSIHRQSNRESTPLIKVNCAAIPHSLIESELFGHEKGAFTGAIKTRRGLFEQADKGTLFLDEIGELGLEVQAKLLRVLQNGEMTRVGSEKVINVDVRVLAATHRDLEEMVADNTFREDLFYRLNVVTIEVPPLRERGSDLGLLAQTFLQEACDEHSTGSKKFSDSALKELSSYSWPGNIRELKNVCERIAILSAEEEIEALPDFAKPKDKRATVATAPSSPVEASDGDFVFGCKTLTWQDFHSEVDRQYLKYILTKTQGNVSEASRVLCLERAYLHRLMKKLGVQRDVIVGD